MQDWPASKTRQSLKLYVNGTSKISPRGKSTVEMQKETVLASFMPERGIQGPGRSRGMVGRRAGWG